MGLFDGIKNFVNERVSVETKTTRTPYGKKHFYARIQFGLPALDVDKVIAEQTDPEWVDQLKNIKDTTVNCDVVHMGADYLLVNNFDHYDEMDDTTHGELTINQLFGYGNTGHIPSEQYEGRNTMGMPVQVAFIGLKKLHIKKADIDSIYIEQVDEVILDTIIATNLIIIGCGKVTINYLNCPHVWSDHNPLPVGCRCGITKESAIEGIDQACAYITETEGWDNQVGFYRSYKWGDIEVRFGK